MSKHALLWVMIAAVTVLQVSYIRPSWKYVVGGATDFAPLYGRALATHQGVVPDYSGEIRLTPPVDPATWKPLEHPESRVDALHPPFEVLMFWPFAFLPYAKAYIAWTIVSMVTFWLALLVLWNFLPRLHPRYEMVQLVCGLSFPVLGCLFDGQNSILLLLLLSLSFAALARGRSVACGVFLALGLFKFHLVLLILGVLLVSRNWRILRGFLYGALALMLGSFAVDGVRSTLRYVPFLLRYGHQISANGSKKNTVMPNVRGLVSVLIGPFNHVQAQLITVAAVSIVLFAAALVWQWKFRDEPVALRFSSAVVVTSLVSYLLFPYNATILVLPFLLVANEMTSGEYSAKLRRTFRILAAITCVSMLVGNFFVYHAAFLLAVETLGLFGVILAAPYSRQGTAQQTSTSLREITVPANA